MKKIQADQKRVQDLWNDLVAVCEKYEWMNHCTDEAHVKFIHPKDIFLSKKFVVLIVFLIFRLKPVRTLKNNITEGFQHIIWLITK